MTDCNELSLISNMLHILQPDGMKADFKYSNLFALKFHNTLRDQGGNCAGSS